jgi:hypothetical protein
MQYQYIHRNDENPSRKAVDGWNWVVDQPHRRRLRIASIVVNSVPTSDGLVEREHLPPDGHHDLVAISSHPVAQTQYAVSGQFRRVAASNHCRWHNKAPVSQQLHRLTRDEHVGCTMFTFLSRRSLGLTWWMRLLPP